MKKEDQTHKYAFWTAVLMIFSVVLVVFIQSNVGTTIIVDFFNSTFFQTASIIIVGWLAYRGVLHQVKTTKEKAQDDRNELIRGNLTIIIEDIWGKRIHSSGILTILKDEGSDIDKKIRDISDSFYIHEMGNFIWVDHPDLRMGIPSNKLRTLSALRYQANIVERQLKTIELAIFDDRDEAIKMLSDLEHNCLLFNFEFRRSLIEYRKYKDEFLKQ